MIDHSLRKIAARLEMIHFYMVCLCSIEDYTGVNHPNEIKVIDWNDVDFGDCKAVVLRLPFGQRYAPSSPLHVRPAGWVVRYSGNAVEQYTENPLLIATLVTA